MSPYLNLRARLERANRNNQKIYSAWETFRKFKWFTLGMVILMPIYPSLSVLGSDYSAATDYDDSTIITAYSDDENTPDYIGENGFVSTDFDVSTPVAQEWGTTQSPPTWAQVPKKSNVPQKYSVLSGDTIAKIAQKYGISIESILWANDLEANETLKVGMVLRVPPVSGVIYRVVWGDTISGIASRYGVDADDIVRVNGLTDAASIRKGMELTIPGAAPRKPPVQSVAKSEAPKKLTPIPQDRPSVEPVVEDSVTGLKSRYAVKYTGLSRGFAWGNCTWYVAQHKSVNWRGNANQWMRNAKAAGALTGQTPVPGAIIQFSGRGYNRTYGHVGIVADVTDEHIIVKDMNYRSINEVTIRKIPRDDATIDGYIYID